MGGFFIEITLTSSFQVHISSTKCGCLSDHIDDLGYLLSCRTCSPQTNRSRSDDAFGLKVHDFYGQGINVPFVSGSKPP